MGIFNFCFALPWESCVDRKTDPPTSCFPVFFFFQRWKERGRQREQQVEEKGKIDKKLNVKHINLLFISSDGVGIRVQRILIICEN